jgi:hypothetical protein
MQRWQRIAPFSGDRAARVEGGSAMRHVSAIVVAVMVLLLLPGAALAAGPGDEPGDAITVSAGTNQFDSTSMTSNPAVDPASCREFEGFSNTMWFSYTPAKSGVTMVDINSFVSEDGSTDFLAIAFVYRVETNGSLTLVGCSAYPATVFFTASAGTTYLILSAALDADDTGEPALSGHGGTFDLTVTGIRGRVLTNRFHAADSFVDEFLSEDCGFEVTVSFDDRIIEKTFIGTDGVRMFTFFIVGSVTFSTADGSEVTFSYAQPFRDTLDGQFTVLGLPLKVVVDGEIFSLDVGRLVFDAEGNVVFDAGSHLFFNNEVDICGLLAG